MSSARSEGGGGATVCRPDPEGAAKRVRDAVAQLNTALSEAAFAGVRCDLTTERFAALCRTDQVAVRVRLWREF